MDISDWVTNDMNLDNKKGLASSPKTGKELTRDEVMGWAMGLNFWVLNFPGLGFIPLRKYHCFVWSLVGIAACAVSFYPFILNLTDVSPLLALFCFVNLFLFYLLDNWISMIETEFQCNLLKLPYTASAQRRAKGGFTLGIKNYGRAYLAGILISGGISVSFGLILGFLEGFSGYVFGMTALWVSVLAFGSYFVLRHRNVLAEDMDCPFIENEEATRFTENWEQDMIAHRKEMRAVPKKEMRLAVIVIVILAAVVVGAVTGLILVLGMK